MAANALTDQFRVYLERCDEEMAGQIISVLERARRHTASSAMPGMTATGSAVAKTEKKQRKKAKSDVAAGGPKRPLNSWMAFRKYYNAMLAPHTQKAISKALTIFWREDPFEAKWAILAKAYSIVRGCREKKDAPLDDFFTICAPLIGVIPPEEYLLWMGWKLDPPQEGDQEKVPQVSRVFTPNLDIFPEEYTTTTLSVDDLVNHCYAAGYGNASNNDSPNMSTQGSLTMVSKPTAITTDDKDETAHTAPFAQTNTTPAFAAATPNNSTDEEFRQELLSNLTAAGQATLEQVTSAPEWAAADSTYSMEFDPAGQYGVFDPAQGVAVADGGVWDAVDFARLAGPEVEQGQGDVLEWSEWLETEP